MLFFNNSEIIIFFQRFWNIFAGGISLLLVPFCMDGVAQGYYYTFNSLIAAQIFFELGVTFVIFQFAVHEGAKLDFDEAMKSYSGDSRSKARIGDLNLKVGQVFRISGILYFAIVGVVGFYLFLNQMPLSDWLVPWLATIFGASVSLYTSAQFALHEGLGRVAEIARAKLIGSFFGYILLWAGLLAGWSLMAVPLLPLTMAAVSIVFYRVFARQIHFGSTDEACEKISWRREIFPLQWRISLSWISGYFIFYIYTPMIFNHWGAVEAGQYGIAITAFSALLTLSLSWISARLPEIGKRIAVGDIGSARVLFKKAQHKSLVTTALFTVGFVATLLFFSWFELSIAQRFPSAIVLVFMGLNLLANCYISSLAMYMRAFKEEPLLIPSVVGAILQFVMLNFTLEYGLSAIALGTAVLTICVGIPWTTFIARSYFSRPDRLMS